MKAVESFPFDLEEDEKPKEYWEPGFYDKILLKEHMYKKVTPFYIKTNIHNCFSCESSTYKKPLELKNFDAHCMIVGRTAEDVNFDHKEGKLLADTLTWANIEIDNVYRTSLIKCEATSTPELCFHHLLSEMLCLKPLIIIALGYDVGKHFDPGITHAGQISQIINSKMITTYQISYVMSDPDLFREYCTHILKAKEIMEERSLQLNGNN